MKSEAQGTLAGQWAVVTGGSKGIGFGIAQALRRDGAHLVLVARDEAGLEAAAKELEGETAPGEVRIIVADTSDRGEIAALFKRLESELPELNIFVANAGTQRLAPFLDVTPEDWDVIVGLNLTGTFFCCQAAARLMTRAADERPANRAIIVVSSNRKNIIGSKTVAYAMTKAALSRLVRGAAAELAAAGIRVNSLSPGVTATPLSQAPHHQAAFERAAANVPLGRAATVDDVGAAALYLAQPASQFVTGIDLIVDGGESLK